MENNITENEAVTAELKSENDELKADMQRVIDNHVLIEKTFEQMKGDVIQLRRYVKAHVENLRQLRVGKETQSWLNSIGEIEDFLNKTAHYEQI